LGFVPVALPAASWAVPTTEVTPCGKVTKGNVSVVKVVELKVFVDVSFVSVMGATVGGNRGARRGGATERGQGRIVEADVQL
jgi:hypothetical protein